MPTPPSEGSISRGEPSGSGSVPPTVLEWPTPSSMVPSSPSSPPPPLEGLPPPFEYALRDPLLTEPAYAGPSSHGSPSSVDAEPDLEHEDDDVDGDGDGGPFFSHEDEFDRAYEEAIAPRLRMATFPSAGSELEDTESADNMTDVMMTPVESEVDESEAAASPAPR